MLPARDAENVAFDPRRWGAGAVPRPGHSKEAGIDVGRRSWHYWRRQEVIRTSRLSSRTSRGLMRACQEGQIPPGTKMSARIGWCSIVEAESAGVGARRSVPGRYRAAQSPSAMPSGCTPVPDAVHDAATTPRRW